MAPVWVYDGSMSRYRLYPTRDQEQQLLAHCGHARFVWNLAVEQLSYSTRERRMPSMAEQSRQLTEARAEYEWLRAGSVTVQQQALRDFHQACANWWRGSHKRPTWRKRGRGEGFRVTNGHGDLKVEQLNRRWSRVWVPKVGWVKFRRSRPVPDAKSYRVTCDAAGRWHIAFAVKPDLIPAPGNFEVVGVDRGVAVTLAYSDGTMLHAPRPAPTKTAQQALARCKRGSNRRHKAKLRLARVHARNADRRKDFVEKATTDLARRFDLIRVEDLRVASMTRSARGTAEQPGRNVRQKAGLNRSILAGGWGMFVRRLEDKAPWRVEKVDPAFTSQTCAACGHIDPRNRENQAFRCRSCGHQAHADVNAAQVIAAGRAVRGAEKSSALKRRPPRAAPAA
jgi:putative transposase